MFNTARTLSSSTSVALAAISFLVLLNGCVSVNLGPKKPGRAEGIQLTPPAVPFVEVKDKEIIADQSWQSRDTGGTISYLSECPETAMSLDALTNETLSVFRAPTIEKQTEDFFNGRESLVSFAGGKMDGIAMRMQAVAFKRNGCSYLITFVSRQEKFDRELEHFTRFLQGFKAP